MITLTLPDEIKIAVVGHVDHGKSTLIGRLLLDCCAISQERLDEVQRLVGHETEVLEPAFLTDQLQVERHDRLTLDTTQACLRTERTALVFIDTPGHRELVGNMLSGTGQADAAILVVDAEQGICAQTHLHLRILRLMAITKVFVVINKMDRVGYQQMRFQTLRQSIVSLLQTIGLSPAQDAILPISALADQQIIKPSNQMPWFRGPCLMDLLNGLEPVESEDEQTVCFPIQDIREIDGTRWCLGRLESGHLAIGDILQCWPSRALVRIERICRGQEDVEMAQTGQCLALRLEDTGLARRGGTLCSPDSPLRSCSQIEMDIVSLLPGSVQPGETLMLRGNLGTCRATVTPGSIAPGEEPDASNNTYSSAADILRLTLQLPQPLLVDPTGCIAALSRLILARRGRTWGVGVICGGTSGIVGDCGDGI